MRCQNEMTDMRGRCRGGRGAFGDKGTGVLTMLYLLGRGQPAE